MSTTQIEWRTVIDQPWLEMDPVRVGAIPSGLGTADQYILLSDESRPLLRVDAYGDSELCQPFSHSMVWRGFLVIGWGACVYLIDIVSREVTECPLEEHEWYCSAIHAGDDYLLAASNERLYRLAPDGSLVWCSERVAIDGIIIDSVEAGVIKGQGECDPPDGWRDFAIYLDTGQLIAPERKTFWARLRSLFR